MLDQISLDDLANVSGGAAPRTSWSEIRAAAQPHCPNTVARYTAAPQNRAQAQAIGNACITEMGSFKAGMGGRSRIQAGIDSAFPR
jgi:hypothetical protein